MSAMTRRLRGSGWRWPGSESEPLEKKRRRKIRFRFLNKIYRNGSNLRKKDKILCSYFNITLSIHNEKMFYFRFCCSKWNRIRVQDFSHSGSDKNTTIRIRNPDSDYTFPTGFWDSGSANLSTGSISNPLAGIKSLPLPFSKNISVIASAETSRV